MKRSLVVMAKYPEPGRVKTRLCPPLLPTEAARLHRAFLTDIAHSVGQLDVARFLAVYPQEDAERLATEVGGEWKSIPQEGEDLGVRLGNVFARRIADGPVVAIGSDAPTLPVDFIERAFDLLSGADLVLGPSLDGGYYLIGLSRPLPGLFEGIRWGSEIVFGQTLEKASELGLSVALLPEWYDVDRPEDIERLLRDASADFSAPATCSVLSTVFERLGKTAET